MYLLVNNVYSTRKIHFYAEKKANQTIMADWLHAFLYPYILRKRLLLTHYREYPIDQ